MAVLKHTEKKKDPCIRQLIQVSQGLHEQTKKKKTLDKDKVEDITLKLNILDRSCTSKYHRFH